MAKGVSLHIGLNQVDAGHYAGWDGVPGACEADAASIEAIARGSGYETRAGSPGSRVWRSSPSRTLKSTGSGLSRLKGLMRLNVLNLVNCPVEDGDLEHFIGRFTTDRRALMRFYSQPWSESRFDRLTAFYNEWRSRLDALDFSALDQAGKVDYVLMRVELEYLLADIGTDRARLAVRTDLLPFRTSVVALEEARWRLEDLDPEKAAATVSAVTDAVKAVRKRVQREKHPYHLPSVV